MNKTNRSVDDLKKDLGKQVSFLVASNKEFDLGNQDEALRLALTIRILVHDTQRSHSLLNQLGLKEKIKFIDSSAAIDPQPSAKGGGIYIAQALPGLVGISFNRVGGLFIPILSLREFSKGPVNFKEWWEFPCIPGPNKRHYSRKDLVLHMANKEGGAHIDEKIDEAYKEFTTSSLGMTFKINGIETGVVNSAADASMRQIAWEVLETLGNLKVAG